MSNNMFNHEKEIKKLENQLLKLSKNTREKFVIEFNNELNLLISRKTKEIKNKIRLNKIDENKTKIPENLNFSMQDILQNFTGQRAGGDPPCKRVQFSRMFCMLKFRFLGF